MTTIKITSANYPLVVELAEYYRARGWKGTETIITAPGKDGTQVHTLTATLEK